MNPVLVIRDQRNPEKIANILSNWRYENLNKQDTSYPNKVPEVTTWNNLQRNTSNHYQKN